MRRSRLLLLALLSMVAAMVLGGCGDDGGEPTATGDGGDRASALTVPERPPEVSGVLTEADGGGFRIGAASDSYYTDMMLIGPADDPDALVVDESGEPLARDDLAVGQPVDVWVGEACAESFPVQCDIEALRVDTGAAE